MDIKPIRPATLPSPVEKIDPSGCKEGRRGRRHDLKQKRSDGEDQGTGIDTYA